MTLILAILLVTGITLLVWGIAKASYAHAERQARSEEPPRWR